MSVTLDEIKQEFPNANYAPDPECPHCHGSGAVGPKKIIVINGTETYTEIDEIQRQACVCVFIGEKKRCDMVVNALRELAQGELLKMGKRYGGEA